MTIEYKIQNLNNNSNIITFSFDRNIVQTIEIINIPSTLDSLSQLFGNCPLLETVIFPDDYEGLNVTNVSKMYADCPLLTTVSMAKFKGSEAGLNVDSMFTNSNFLTNLFIHHSLLNFITLPNDYVHVNNYRWVSSTTENNETFTDLPLSYATFYVLNAMQDTTITYSGNPIFYYEIEDVVPENHYIGINTIFDLDKTKFLFMNPEISQIKTQLFDNNNIPYMSDAGNTLESGKGYIMKIDTFCNLMFGINILTVIQHQNNIMITLQHNVAATTLECTLSFNGVIEFVQTVSLSDAVTVDFQNWNKIENAEFENNKVYNFELKLDDFVLHTAQYSFEIVETIELSFAISTYFYGSENFDRDKFAFSSSDQDLIEVIPTNVISGFVKQSNGYYIQPSDLHPYSETFRFSMQANESLYIWYNTDRGFNDQPDLSISDLNNINQIAFKDTSDINYTAITYTGEQIDLFPDSLGNSGVYENPIKWKLTAGVPFQLFTLEPVSGNTAINITFNPNETFNTTDYTYVIVLRKMMNDINSPNYSYYYEVVRIYPNFASGNVITVTSVDNENIPLDVSKIYETFEVNILYLFNETFGSIPQAMHTNTITLSDYPTNFFRILDISVVQYENSLKYTIITNVDTNHSAYSIHARYFDNGTWNTIVNVNSVDNTGINNFVIDFDSSGLKIVYFNIVEISTNDIVSSEFTVNTQFTYNPNVPIQITSGLYKFRHHHKHSHETQYMKVTHFGDTIYNALFELEALDSYTFKLKYDGIYVIINSYNNLETTTDINAIVPIWSIYSEYVFNGQLLIPVADVTDPVNENNYFIVSTNTGTLYAFGPSWDPSTIFTPLNNEWNDTWGTTYDFIKFQEPDYSYSMVKPTESFATLSRSAQKLQKYNAPTDGSVLTVPQGMCVVKVHDEAMIETYELWLRSSGESTVIFVNSENVELGFENI